MFRHSFFFWQRRSDACHCSSCNCGFLLLWLLLLCWTVDAPTSTHGAVTITASWTPKRVSSCANTATSCWGLGDISTISWWSAYCWPRHWWPPCGWTVFRARTMAAPPLLFVLLLFQLLLLLLPRVKLRQIDLFNGNALSIVPYVRIWCASELNLDSFSLTARSTDIKQSGDGISDERVW